MASLVVHGRLFTIFLLPYRRTSVALAICAGYFALAWALTPIVGQGHFLHSIVDHPFSAIFISPLKVLSHFLPLSPFEFARLGSFFIAGAVIATFWRRLKANAPVFTLSAALVLLFARQILPAETILRAFALALLVISLGHLKIFAWYSKGGDPSYGMYIYGWPIQQFCLLTIGSFWPSLATALLTTTLVGYATWHGFEKRALARRHSLARVLESIARLGAALIISLTRYRLRRTHRR